MIVGCIGRVVIAASLLVAGAALWHFRDAWVPKVRAYFEEQAGEVKLELPKVGAVTAGGVRWVLHGAGVAA